MFLRAIELGIYSVPLLQLQNIRGHLDRRIVLYVNGYGVVRGVLRV